MTGKELYGGVMIVDEVWEKYFGGWDYISLKKRVKQKGLWIEI